MSQKWNNVTTNILKTLCPNPQWSELHESQWKSLPTVASKIWVKLKGLHCPELCTWRKKRMHMMPSRNDGEIIFIYETQYCSCLPRVPVPQNCFESTENYLYRFVTYANNLMYYYMYKSLNTKCFERNLIWVCSYHPFYLCPASKVHWTFTLFNYMYTYIIPLPPVHVILYWVSWLKTTFHTTLHLE